MSTRRKHETYSTKQKIGTNGRAACLVCQRDIVDPRRSTFCGQDCADRFYIKTRPEFVRRKLLIRDRGVCRACGKNVFAGTVFERLPLEKLVHRRTGHLWQADHIVEVADGGGECDLDNYQTLCTEDHKRKTAEFAARRAQQRREAKQ